MQLHRLSQQPVSHAQALLHTFSIDGIEIDAMVNQVGEGLGELAEGEERLFEGFQRRGGGAFEATLGEEGKRYEHLTGCALVSVEGCQFMARFHQIVVGQDNAFKDRFCDKDVKHV